MTTRDKLFIDTNILVYLSNESSAFHAPVLTQFTTLTEEYDMYISRQVLREYAVIMTRPGIVAEPLTPDEVVEDIKKWQNLFTVLDETAEVTDKLQELLSAYQLKGKRIHDANIAATMLVHAISCLLTKNVDDFQKFKEITVIVGGE